MDFGSMLNKLQREAAAVTASSPQQLSTKNNDSSRNVTTVTPMVENRNKRTLEECPSTTEDNGSQLGNKKVKTQDSPHLLKCFYCDIQKPKSSFSKSQRKKSTTDKKCLDCTPIVGRMLQAKCKTISCSVCNTQKDILDFIPSTVDPSYPTGYCKIDGICRVCIKTPQGETQLIETKKQIAEAYVLKDQGAKSQENAQSKPKNIQLVQCFYCEETKEASCFSKKQRNKADPLCSNCISAVHPISIAKKREASEKQHAVKEVKKAAVTLLETEKKEYESCKAKYEQEMLKAQEEGRDIEKDDNAVYIITAFNNGDPILYGVYTSSAKTKEVLPKAFEDITKKGNFKDGKFQDDPERVAKFDVSEFVSPLMTSGRVMFESHKQNKHDSWANHFASVAVNRISLNGDSAYGATVPLLHHCNISYPHQSAKKSDTVKEKNENKSTGEDGKVYIIYGYNNCEDSEIPVEFYVQGVYTNKERALKAANIPYPEEKEHGEDDDDNDDMDDFGDEDDEDVNEYFCASRDEASKKESGILYSIDKSIHCCVDVRSTGILTVEVDQVLKKPIELHTLDVWMNPRPSIFQEY